jgi:hypothetical protein
LGLSSISGAFFEGEKLATGCHLDYVAKHFLPARTKRLDVRALPIFRNIQYLECAGLAPQQNSISPFLGINFWMLTEAVYLRRLDL